MVVSPNKIIQKVAHSMLFWARENTLFHELLEFKSDLTPTRIFSYRREGRKNQIIFLFVRAAQSKGVVFVDRLSDGSRVGIARSRKNPRLRQPLKPQNVMIENPRVSRDSRGQGDGVPLRGVGQRPTKSRLQREKTREEKKRRGRLGEEFCGESGVCEGGILFLLGGCEGEGGSGEGIGLPIFLSVEGLLFGVLEGEGEEALAGRIAKDLAQTAAEFLRVDLAIDLFDGGFGDFFERTVTEAVEFPADLCGEEGLAVKEGLFEGLLEAWGEGAADLAEVMLDAQADGDAVEGLDIDLNAACCVLHGFFGFEIGILGERSGLVLEFDEIEIRGERPRREREMMLSDGRNGGFMGVEGGGTHDRLPF